MSMPHINANGVNIYYEVHGTGKPLVLIQGAFVSSTMWKPQIELFSKEYQVIVYDIRGHGQTGPTDAKKYSLELFADDLHALLDKLEIQKPVICGLSLGGMIGQVYAIKYPDDLSALILADTAVSMTLTFWDKMMVYFLAPKWVMLSTLRLMGVKNFIRFSFWYASVTRSKEWLGNEEIVEYEKNEMLSLEKKEYLKIFGSIYDFRLQDLENIHVPTLVLYGEFESSSVIKHHEKLHELIPNSSLYMIPNAGHTSNLENSEVFNSRLNDFLKDLRN